jgi:hypothetical protein
VGWVGAALKSPLHRCIAQSRLPCSADGRPAGMFMHHRAVGKHLDLPRTERPNLPSSVCLSAEMMDCRRTGALTGTDWDAISADRVMRNLRRHLRQLQAYLDTSIEDMEAGQWEGIVGALLYPRRPAKAETLASAVGGVRLMMSGCGVSFRCPEARWRRVRLRPAHVTGGVPALVRR